jgi:hypothetical protein
MGQDKLVYAPADRDQVVPKWVRLWQDEDERGSRERSRRPHHYPHQTSATIEKKATKAHNVTGYGVKRVRIEGLRRMPPWRKLELVADLNETVRALAIAGLRQRHPNDTPAQQRRRLADLVLEPELAARVYGSSAEKLG